MKSSVMYVLLSTALWGYASSGFAWYQPKPKDTYHPAMSAFLKPKIKGYLVPTHLQKNLSEAKNVGAERIDLGKKSYLFFKSEFTNKKTKSAGIPIHEFSNLIQDTRPVLSIKRPQKVVPLGSEVVLDASRSFDPNGLLYSVGIIVVLLSIGVVIFNKVEKSFMDTV